MNCMMNQMNEKPMMEIDMEDEELKMMYPKIYVKLMPMIMQHCDKHEEMYGKEHCPKHEHIMDMCDKVYKKVEVELDGELGEEDDDEDMRVRRYGRRRAIRDLIGILFLNELRRRRRRRRPRPRPRPHYGWY
jgi:hypothetical protein